MTDDHKRELEQLKNPAHQPTEQPSRSERRDDADEMSAAHPRFRDTAEHIVTQLDIEATMWQLLGKQPPW